MSNPLLNESTFSRGSLGADAASMTVAGTANKALMFLFVAIVAAAVVWLQLSPLIEVVPQAEQAVEATGDAAANAIESLVRVPAETYTYLMVGCIGGLIVAIVTIFAQHLAWLTGWFYAALEGVALGALSVVFEAAYPGIVASAVGLTLGLFVVAFLLYGLRIVTVGPTFTTGVVVATVGVALYYLVAMFAGAFGYQVPLIHDTGWAGIAFSGFVVLLATANLLLDFDQIERGSLSGAPKYMEWYGAFTLLVTLVWLYIEVLRLLAKLRSSD